MDINEAFPSKYLKAADLGGQPRSVTMDRIETEEVGRSKEWKVVVYFVGKEKGLVLNKTNAKKIVEITGAGDTDEWPGHQIVLYPTETEFAGETVDCVRVRGVGGKQKMTMTKPAPTPLKKAVGAEHREPAAAAGADDDDDIPF